MRSLRVSVAAQADVAEILGWTEVTFGDTARDRYEALIVDGFHELQRDPEAPGNRAVEGRIGIRSRHLNVVRSLSRGSEVKRPRHVVIYRADDEVVVVGRVLHDAMDVERHLKSWVWD